MSSRTVGNVSFVIVKVLPTLICKGLQERKKHFSSWVTCSFVRPISENIRDRFVIFDPKSSAALKQVNVMIPIADPARGIMILECDELSLIERNNAEIMINSAAVTKPGRINWKTSMLQLWITPDARKHCLIRLLLRRFPPVESLEVTWHDQWEYWVALGPISLFAKIGHLPSIYDSCQPLWLGVDVCYHQDDGVCHDGPTYCR